MSNYLCEMTDDARVITLVKLIADKHNVCVDIDPINHTIKFHCSEQKEYEIAADLDEYFDTF